MVMQNSFQPYPPPDYKQTIDGYTLRAEGSYFEDNQIKVYLTFSGYKGNKPALAYGATVGDEQQTSYPYLSGAGNNRVAGLDIIELSFDGSNLPYTTTAPYLAIAVDVYEIEAARKIDASGNQILARVIGTPLMPANKVAATKLVGTFDLELEKLILEPLRSAIIAQTASSNGITVTLERTLVTPTTVIVYLSVVGTPFNPNVGFSPNLVVLNAGNKGPFGTNDPNDVFVPESGGSGIGGTLSRIYFTDLYSTGTNWKLNIDSFMVDEWTVESGVASHVNRTYSISGPWNFQFSVPSTKQR